MGTSTARSSLDIIVPVYKSVELTTRCLDSLAAHIHEIADREPRIIAINDSPDDPEAQQMLDSFAQRNPEAIMLENERNLGFVGTVNRGLEIAVRAGRDVILVNADTETYPQTLTNLVAAADSDPQIGFVSPRSNNASLCSLPHFCGAVIADRVEAHRRWKILSRTMPPFHFSPTAVGFYLFIRHAVIANFGFLDKEFGLGYEEENDLIMRANKVGYRAVLANNSFAYHAGSASFGLLDMNLKAHQGANLQKMAQRHPEYLPLVRRYEGSAHFRAERLLSQAMPLASRRPKIAFDLTSVGPNHNGTNEMAMAIIKAFHARHAAEFEINFICTPQTFKFHALDELAGVLRHEVDLRTSEKFAVGVQFGQPFNVHAINVLEDIAAVNIFGMLDTIAEDCGYLSITHPLETLWGHVASNSSGLFFNSKYSEQVFLVRHPAAEALPRYARPLATKLSSYPKKARGEAAEHVLILGNHFAHKASDITAGILAAAFPTVQFVVLGKENRVSGNIRAYRSGTLGARQVESLYSRASVVVLPSYVEGFGFGLVHALAAKKVVVARDIAATREILATYASYSGVQLYSHDGELVCALRTAMSESVSSVDDSGAHTWEDWADGFASFCKELLERDDVFGRLVARIRAGDFLRKAELFDRMQSLAPAPSIETTATVREGESGKQAVEAERERKYFPQRQVKRLLALDGEEFVYHSYATILGRLPDSDGLINYLTELQSGVGKLEIIARLKRSTEGRRINAKLAGFYRELLRSRVATLFGTSARADS